MHSSFSRIDHRPWPLPAGRFNWRQSWIDLLFAHWRIDANLLRPLVPKELEIQEFDGSSWIGVVPFRMENVMLRGVPNMPWVSAFAELNVRVYVEYKGRSGVWFLSLDAANSVAVWAARKFFHLPYYWAAIQIQERDGGFDYASKRRRGGLGAGKSGQNFANFQASYKPISAVYEAQPGTLEHWLTERYCLFAQSPAGELFSADVHHVPWPLQKAEATISENRLFEPHNLTVEGPPELLHFSKSIDVAVWNLQRC